MTNSRRYNLISIEDSIFDYISSVENKKNNGTEGMKISGIVFSDSSYAEQVTFDHCRPGNSYNLGEYKFESPYRNFSFATSVGILCSTATTCLSVMAGKINDKLVLFIHPTSVEVNYSEVRGKLKTLFPDLFYVETGTNFNSAIRQYVFEE